MAARGSGIIFPIYIQNFKNLLVTLIIRTNWVVPWTQFFPQPTNFHESMMSKKSQTVKSLQTDNIRAPFKCDIMVFKQL